MRYHLILSWYQWVVTGEAWRWLSPDSFSGFRIHVWGPAPTVSFIPSDLRTLSDLREFTFNWSRFTRKTPQTLHGITWKILSFFLLLQTLHWTPEALKMGSDQPVWAQHVSHLNIFFSKYLPSLFLNLNYNYEVVKQVDDCSCLWQWSSRSGWHGNADRRRRRVCQHRRNSGVTRALHSHQVPRKPHLTNGTLL